MKHIHCQILCIFMFISQNNRVLKIKSLSIFWVNRVNVALSKQGELWLSAKCGKSLEINPFCYKKGWFLLVKVSSVRRLIDWSPFSEQITSFKHTLNERFGAILNRIYCFLYLPWITTLPPYCGTYVLKQIPFI